ncbi:nucleoside diphosphate kinase regulator [Hoeflea alexandrii]|uniref:nucleoside diphosphate kinase regulator n=1 Tax=Hoeflea alexandrii TaxID=288436 RepID=UPI0022AFBA02|nr:nucleoside diphosphate kinase regulator [Hoeflea alexandrii]MCZ4290227.1 nucleoside diphosphate kinase regulator [Hoeflea alexandrii]
MQAKPRRKPRITISEGDYNRLSNLAVAWEQNNPFIAACLMNEIDRARIVSDRSMRAAFVRMGSTVTYVVDGNPGRTVTLVYPADADIEDGRISITTPVGTALIGLKAGQSISFLTGNGRAHDLTVIEVTQNPEGYQDR